MLSVKQLSFDYPAQTLSKRTNPLLHGVTWALQSGSMLHLRGRNGSGKTTLLKLLAGLIRPDAGHILYADQDIWTDLPTYQQNISYLGHKSGLSPALTPLEHGLFDVCALPERHTVESALQQLSLWDVKDLPCHLLSAGQKRRVALLRLRLSPAKLWLLDEPLVALDEAGIMILMSFLQAHIAVGGQVVYTSHQPLPWIGDQHEEYVLC